MTKYIRKYGVIILFYLVIVASVTMVSSRMKYLNSASSNITVTNNK